MPVVLILQLLEISRRPELLRPDAIDVAQRKLVRRDRLAHLHLNLSQNFATRSP